MVKFPSEEWVTLFKEELNQNVNYAKAAQKWEGDILFIITPDDRLESEVMYYMDLWHGQCRSATIVEKGEEKKPAFILKASRSEFIRGLNGKLDPMQAMLTRKLRVEGNMAYMLRNVPTVLDFVRCAREVGIEE